MGGHGYGGVGTTTYDVTRSMILRGSAAIDTVPWGKVGSDGRFYAQYGIGHSLYNIPFYLLGHVLARMSPALASQYDRLTMFTTLLGQPVISALTCALLLFFCLRLGYSRDTSIACALLYGLGTQAWMYAQLDFSETILTFFLLLSVYQLVCAIRIRPPAKALTAFALAGVFAGVAMSVKIAAAIVFPCFYLFIIIDAVKKRSPIIQHHSSELNEDRSIPLHSIIQRLLAFSIPLFIFGFSVVGLYNVMRFGTPFETGYGDEFTFHYRDVLRQFGDNLWSLEGSIFLYSPVILFGIAGAPRFYWRFKHVACLVFAVIGSFFIFYPFSTNELYYGPRYLTPTLPFFMLVAGAWFDTSPVGRTARKFRHAVIILLLFLGSFQQVVGVVVNYHSYYWRIQYALPLADPEVRESEPAHILRATPELPHLAGHLWLLGQGLRGLIQPGGLPLQGVTLSTTPDSGARNDWIPYYGLDLWWCHRKLIVAFGLIFPLSVLSVLCSIIYVSCYRVQKMRRRS